MKIRVFDLYISNRTQNEAMMGKGPVHENRYKYN